VLRQWNPSGGLNDADALVDAALANAMYTMRASFHSGLRTTPWSISFPSQHGYEHPLDV
jgi:hypothetical protein